MRKLFGCILAMAVLLAIASQAHAQVYCQDDTGVYVECGSGSGGGSGGGTSGGGDWQFCTDPYCSNQCTPFISSTCGYTAHCGPSACWAPCPANPGLPGTCWDQSTNCAAAYACISGWPVLAVSGFWVDCENFNSPSGLSPTGYYDLVCLGPGIG